MYDIASGVWMPICDTNTHSRGASDTWFIVSVSLNSDFIDNNFVQKTGVNKLDKKYHKNWRKQE